MFVSRDASVDLNKMLSYIESRSVRQTSVLPLHWKLCLTV